MIYKFIFIFFLLILSFQVLLSKNRTKNAFDFLVAGRSLSYFGVSGVIIGTLVGGASTIGTVQMAYFYGLAGIIFTLGSGIACLILGFFLSKKLYEANIVTITEFLGQTFGARFRKVSSVFSTLGIYVHVVAQIIASGAIISQFFNTTIMIGSLISSLLILIYSIFGGVKSSSVIGKLKIFVIYFVMLICFVIAFKNGKFDIVEKLKLEIDPSIKWLSIFSYGFKSGFMDILFMIIGVLSTQVYLQAVFSAKSKKNAMLGCILSGVLIPPVGLFGVYIGMYVRSTGFNANGGADVLPYFINSNFHPMLSAIFLAFILFIILGTASGLVVGVVTNIFNDFFITAKKGLLSLNEKKEMYIVRLVNFTVVFTGYFIVAIGIQSKILKWSYLSMGIRGGAVFLPLISVLYFKDRIDLKKYEFLFYLMFLLIIYYMI